MFPLGYPEGVGIVHPLLIVLAAMAIDMVFGDPPGLWRRVPHPTVLIGRLVDHLDTALNRGPARRLTGVVTVATVAGISAAVGWAIAYGTRLFDGGWVVEALLASTLIAFRSLVDHVQDVAKGLDRGLSDGREAVSHIVGRDPETLDEHGVARAAIESGAENFSDGVAAPVFWFALFGLPGLCAYKAINTLDSMIGHRSERYAAFGWAAARLDDAVNFLPARLAGLLIVASAGKRWQIAQQTMMRDAGKHRSFNAGWQEAPMAGALGLALAGPRSYDGSSVPDAWMGSGRQEATADDIRQSVKILHRAFRIMAVVVLGCMFL